MKISKAVSCKEFSSQIDLNSKLNIKTTNYMTVGRLLDLSETVKKEKECLPRAIAMMMK